MTTCPACNRVVDPLRARAVGVRDGKVVAYCSAECAGAAESKPTAVPKAVVSIDSGPVIEIIREPSDGTAVSASVKARKSEPAMRAPAAAPVAPAVKPPAQAAESAPAAAPKRANKPSASSVPSLRPAAGTIVTPTKLPEPPHTVAPPPEPGRGRGVTIAVVVLLVVGAGVAALVYKYAFAAAASLPASSTGPSAPSPAVAARPAPAKPEPHPEPSPQITPQAAVAQAITVLRGQLHSESPRVQRVAASALARTHDADAIALLVTAMTKETSDLARLGLAYAVARGGDKRGSDALVAGLGSPTRDPKLVAAGWLAELRDERAVSTLTNYLDVSQNRIGTALELAPFAEPHAIKLLEGIIADPKSIADDKARAQIALGVAGHADTAPALHALLADPRFNTFAAEALARLHDPAARPVLVKQLEVSSLRVAAARALRLLEPGLDATPLLPALVAALASAKDTEQVQAAETILLLAGPAAWSEHT